jgi:hypothetical protein
MSRSCKPPKKEFPMLLYGITTSPRPRKAQKGIGKLFVDSVPGQGLRCLLLPLAVSCHAEVLWSGRAYGLCLAESPLGTSPTCRGLGPISILDDRADSRREVRFFWHEADPLHHRCDVACHEDFPRQRKRA